ncbi:MAG: hypothetical protein ACON4A_08375 [Flavobacteriaceae bacterium]
MKLKLFLKQNFYKIRALLIFIGVLIFWYAFYFADQNISADCIPCYLKDYRMYLALIFAILSSLLTNNILFNSENIKRIKSKDKDEIRRNLKKKPSFQFNSKGAYFFFMLLSIPTQIFLVFYLVYYELLPFIIGQESISNNDMVFYLCLFFGIVVSLGVHSYMRVFKIDEIMMNIKNKKKINSP